MSLRAFLNALKHVLPTLSGSQPSPDTAYHREDEPRPSDLHSITVYLNFGCFSG